MSGDKLTAMAEALRMTPAHVLRGAGYLDRAADMLEEATELVEALRAMLAMHGSDIEEIAARNKARKALALHNRGETK